jgi:hypothetical protein
MDPGRLSSRRLGSGARLISRRGPRAARCETARGPFDAASELDIGGEATIQPRGSDGLGRCVPGSLCGPSSGDCSGLPPGTQTLSALTVDTIGTDLYPRVRATRAATHRAR